MIELKNSYCGTVYVRCIKSKSQISVKLFCVRTKVVPLKILSIPRLELSPALWKISGRKSEIGSCNYVESLENPTDLGSRGVNLDKILICGLLILDF